MSSLIPSHFSILVRRPQIAFFPQSLLQDPNSPSVVPRPTSTELSEHLKSMLLAAVSSRKAPCGAWTRRRNADRWPRGHHWGFVQKPQLHNTQDTRTMLWCYSIIYAWCCLYGLGGGFGILGSWVQILLSCWINIRWGWLCLSFFWGWQNKYQLAGILCLSGDLSRIVPNSPGNCLGSTNALHRVWSWWLDGWIDWR